MSNKMPAIKTMFLKKEYKAVYSFFKKNKGQGLLECGIELGYSPNWVKFRAQDLVASKKLRQLVGKNNRITYEVR